MEFILAAALIALLLFLNFIATIDINETGILQGAQKKQWLLIVWLTPFIGFLIFQIVKPKLYGPFQDGGDKSICEDTSGEAMDALLNLPEAD